MVSLTIFQWQLLIRPTVRTLKREKITEGELWKPTRPLELMLKTVSYQPHRAKNVAYGLPFYGIVWILVRQGPLRTRNLDAIFLICSEILLGKGLYRAEACLFSFLTSIRCEFLLRGVSLHSFVFVTYLLLLFMGELKLTIKLMQKYAINRTIIINLP